MAKPIPDDVYITEYRSQLNAIILDVVNVLEKHTESIRAEDSNTADEAENSLDAVAISCKEIVCSHVDGIVKEIKKCKPTDRTNENYARDRERYIQVFVSVKKGLEEISGFFAQLFSRIKAVIADVANWTIHGKDWAMNQIREAFQKIRKLLQ